MGHFLAKDTLCAPAEPLWAGLASWAPSSSTWFGALTARTRTLSLLLPPDWGRLLQTAGSGTSTLLKPAVLAEAWLARWNAPPRLGLLSRFLHAHGPRRGCPGAVVHPRPHFWNRAQKRPNGIACACEIGLWWPLLAGHTQHPSVLQPPSPPRTVHHRC